MSQRLESYQRFQHWKVQNVDEFIEQNYDNFVEDDELEQLTQNIRMPRILSLNMSCPTLRMSSPLPTAYSSANWQTRGHKIKK